MTLKYFFMYLIQILLPLFFIFAAIKAIGKYKKGDITLGMMFIWLLVWIVGVVVVLTPNSTFYAARFLGVTRGADAVVYSALAVLFFVVFRMLVSVEKLKREVTKLTRELALRDKKE